MPETAVHSLFSGDSLFAPAAVQQLLLVELFLLWVRRPGPAPLPRRLPVPQWLSPPGRRYSPPVRPGCREPVGLGSSPVLPPASLGTQIPDPNYLRDKTTP